MCNPQAKLPTFLAISSMLSFHVLTQCLARPRSPLLEEKAMLCEAAPPLCEADLRAVEEAGQAILTYFVEKEINMLPVSVSLPLLFD